jgi:hypothetical protein
LLGVDLDRVGDRSNSSARDGFTGTPR